MINVTKQYTVTLAIQQRVIEGILSNPASKKAIDEEMESACLAILDKRYTKLGSDLRDYLKMRYPDDGDHERVEADTKRKSKLSTGAPRGKKSEKKNEYDNKTKSAENVLIEDTTAENDTVYEKVLSGNISNAGAATPTLDTQATSGPYIEIRDPNRSTTPHIPFVLPAGNGYNSVPININTPGGSVKASYRDGPVQSPNTFQSLYNQQSQAYAAEAKSASNKAYVPHGGLCLTEDTAGSP